jgi:hypothetical protein
MSLSNNLGQILGAFLGKDNALVEWLHKRSEASRRQEMLVSLCDKAMRRARVDSATSSLVLSDVGLIAYRVPESPRITRFSPIATDNRWLRPFVEFTARQKMDVLLQISLVDRGGNVLFTEQQRVKVRGKQRIVAQHWLPLEDLYAAVGRWSMPIYLNSELFAIHQFEWVDINSEDEILNQLRTDGEINDDLQHAVKRGKFRKMSLEELLADQED